MDISKKIRIRKRVTGFSLFGMIVLIIMSMIIPK